MSAQLKVRVIMSFGSEDEDRKRFASVYYSCLNFLIDKYSKRSDTDLDFDFCKRFTGNINDPLLQEIAEADILIALLDQNVTVTYELAFRHILRGQMILFLMEGAKVPVYLENWAHHKFDGKLVGKINNQVKDKDNFPDLKLGDLVLSPAIKSYLKDEKNDTYTILSSALKEIAASTPRPSAFIEKVMFPFLQKNEAQDSFNISVWGKSLYYPLSILKISWNGITDIENGRYSEKDVVEGPLVHDANHEFIELYQLRVLKGESDSDTLRRLSPLGLAELVKHLESLINPKAMDMEKFLEDQARLAQLVIFNEPEAAERKFSTKVDKVYKEDKYAKVPIVLSEGHEKMPGRSMLPCLLAKRHDGDFPKGKHNTYLLVAYIDITGFIGAPVG